MREKCTERTAKKEQAKGGSMFLKGTSSPVHRREVNGWRKGEVDGEETEGNRIVVWGGAEKTPDNIRHNGRSEKNRLAVGAIEEFKRRQKCHRKEQPAYNAGLMDEGEIKQSETPATEMPDTGHRGAEER